MSVSTLLVREKEADLALVEAQELTKTIAATLAASAHQLQAASAQLTGQTAGIQSLAPLLQQQAAQSRELRDGMEKLSQSLKNALASLPDPSKSPQRGTGWGEGKILALGAVTGVLAALSGVMFWMLMQPEPVIRNQLSSQETAHYLAPALAEEIRRLNAEAAKQPRRK